MKLVIQRVIRASVSTNGKIVGQIGLGLFILLGIHKDDTEKQIDELVEKLYKLRVMKDREDKMNLTVADAGGEFLIVSQFTLYADTKGGNRPSFITAARPEIARPLYEKFVSSLKRKGAKVSTGAFGEYMDIKADLDGPVTIVIES